MDQRDTPGISPPEGPRTRRFPRLMAPPIDRRLGHRRVALVGLASVSALALIGFAVVRLGLLAKSYVDTNPAYRLTYREIALEPPPPPWFLGGADAFLEHVLGRSGEFRSFSALDFDPDHLRLLFKQSPWVERESGVIKAHPNRVTVRLTYREPVAVERLPDETERTVIDHDAVILPREDVDPALLKQLVRLSRFDPPTDPRSGQVWSRIDPQSGMLVRNERVDSAARLAAFFRQRLAPEGATATPFPRIYIHAWGESGLYAQVGANLMFRWSEARTDARPDRLTPEAKWDSLQRFVRRRPPADDQPPSYWKFTAQGIEPVPADEPGRSAARPDRKSAVRRTRGVPQSAARRIAPGY